MALIWWGNLGFNQTPSFKLQTNKDKQTCTIVGQIANFSTGTYKQYIPAIYASNPIYPYLLLESSEVNLLEGDIAEITLIYSLYSIQGQTLPQSTISETASAVTEDLKNHPDYSTWVSNGWIDSTTGYPNSSFPDKLVQGSTSFIVGAKELSYTSYSEDDPGEEYLDSLGTIITDMPGNYDGSMNNWLLESGSKSQQGGYWALTLNYKFSALGWSTYVYTGGNDLSS